MRFNTFPPLLRGPRGILALLYAAIAIITQFFPLVGDLHYEFAALTAIAASLLTGLTMVFTGRSRVIAHDNARGNAHDNAHGSIRGSARDIDGASIWEMAATGMLLSLIPLAIALVASLFGDSCGVLEGIAWYLLLVPASAAISAVLTAFARLAARKGWTRLLIFLLLWLGSILRGAWEGFAGPHIFLYAWQVGYFPGGSWDAELPITPLLLIYRAAHLLVAGLLALVIAEIAHARRQWNGIENAGDVDGGISDEAISDEKLSHEKPAHEKPAHEKLAGEELGTARVSDEGISDEGISDNSSIDPGEHHKGDRRFAGEKRPYRRRPELIVIGIVVALAALALVTHRADLGLTRTDGWLRAELGDSLRTRFATIYYHDPSTDSLDLWRAANLTDFYIVELAGALGIPEDRIEPIAIYLYDSPAHEKLLVGTSSAAFTKPWARKLNMTFADVGSTLRHELAHVMIAPYGNTLGISISQGLLEGSAMALENDYLWRTLHEYARSMYTFNLAPPPEAIMSVGGFSSRRTSVSYVIAGSFSRWLIERYGMERYLQAFPWADFEGAYGKSLTQLSEEYMRELIDPMPPPDPSYEPTMRYLFGGGSFFFQKCLRRIGSLNGDGFEALAQERYGAALERFRASLDEGINYGARAGVLRALAGLGRYQELLDSSALYARDTASYPLLPYLIEQGDAFWALGDTAGARRMYDSMLALDISRNLSLRAALRLHFMQGDPALTGIMRTYFTRPMKKLQRVMVLTQAQAVAPTSSERLMLGLMRTSLTLPEHPLSSADQVVPLLLDLPSTIDSGYHLNDAFTPLGQFIIGTIAGDLAAAVRYAGVRGASSLNEPAFTELLGFAPAGFLPGSQGYLNEEREVARRFEEYLKRHMIYPERAK